MIATVAKAAGAFAATNIDDMIVLALLFFAGGTCRRIRRQIVVGQYLGISILVLLSVVGAMGLLVVSTQWVGLLGLVPLALGIRGLLELRRVGAGEGEAPLPRTGILPVASLTIAGGADNISVYVPLFRGLSAVSAAVTVGIFLLLIGPWCWLAAVLGEHRKLVPVVNAAGRWLVSAVFVVLGGAILVSSGAAAELVSMI